MIIFVALIYLVQVFVAQVYGQTCTAPVSERRDCGDVSTTPNSCVQKGCCWVVTNEQGRPNCFYKIDSPIGTCTASVFERRDCGDATTTPASCVQKGCCWNVTNVQGRPNCFYKTTNPQYSLDTCAMSVNERKDCGDMSTTSVSCVNKGCCWQVTDVPGRPNCFYKTTVLQQNSNKKVYMHMMPWFETKATNGGKWGIHWTMANKDPNKYVNGKRDIASHYHPIIDLYASGDTKVIDWQLALMKLSGVAGVLIDWPGTINAFDYPANLRNSEAIIAGCQRHGLEFAIVYEDHNLGIAHDAGKLADIVGQGRADMTYLQTNYFSKSNYIRINGAPLLLDFGPQTLKGGQWADIFAPLSPKPTFLTLWNQAQDAGGIAQGEYAWIYNNFIEGLNNFYKYKDIKYKFGVVYPGFDPVYGEGGWPGPGWKIPVSLNTFEQTLDMALNYSDYVQIATWNDYGEGTMVEPTVELGYAFLVTLQHKLGVKYTLADLEKVTQLYNRSLY